MQIQRPPRGQAWPGAGVCPESGVFNLVCSTIWVFRFTLVHLLVIWQCPPGTEFGDDLLQFNSFSVHPVFQRTSGLRTRNYIGLWFISVSILWGRAPQKLLTKFFKFLEIILCPKNSKIIFSILGLKIIQIDLIWSQGYGKTVFWRKTKFKKFRFLYLENFQNFFKI